MCGKKIFLANKKYDFKRRREMSRFTQQEETIIVKNAMELTAAIQIENNELKKIRAEKFRSLPNPPKRKILSKTVDVRPQYPPKPKTTYRYAEYLNEIIERLKKRFFPVGIIAVIIIVLGTLLTRGFLIALLISVFWLSIVPVLIITYCSYCTKRNALNQQLSETPEYLQAVENAEKAAEKQKKEEEEKIQQKQRELDAEYEEEKKQYENVTIPEYNKELNTWNAIQERKIDFLEEELKYNNEALSDLYDFSKLISKTYRELWILKWLYEDMSTSDHDIRYATELLDRDRQRLITAEAGKWTRSAIYDMTRTMMDGFNAVYNAIEYGNDLQEDSIEMLTRTRRDINIGNLVGAVQKHNTNKMLESLLSKK